MQNNFLAVQLANAVSVGIHNAGVVQQLCGGFGVKGIGVGQILVTIIQAGGQNREAGGIQAADGD